MQFSNFIAVATSFEVATQKYDGCYPDLNRPGIVSQWWNTVCLYFKCLKKCLLEVLWLQIPYLAHHSPFSRHYMAKIEVDWTS